MISLLGAQCNGRHMTIIEIRPFRNGWQVYEGPRVQPVFLNQGQAITYAQGCGAFALARFGFRKAWVRLHMLAPIADWQRVICLSRRETALALALQLAVPRPVL
jgi:hypothetical protein